MSRPHPARRRTARWLLACFALVLLAAGLTPLVRAAPVLERVCTASGEVRWVPAAAAGADAAPNDAGSHLLECALCLPTLAAAPAALAALEQPPAPALHGMRAHAQAHRPPLSRAPFPPRAPPACQAARPAV